MNSNHSLRVTLYFLTIITNVWSRHVFARSQRFHTNEITGFNWSDIIPSEKLQWHDCYDSYQCARLEVPLDWTNLSNSNTVALAVTRVPATVPHDDPTFSGSVLINPGGPGGSGVDEVIWGGYGIRDSIIDNEDNHFEIVSWDPRGVHHTTPSVSCFGSEWERQTWQYRDWAMGQLDSSENALNVKWAASKSFSSLCTQSKTGKFEDGSDMRQFVSTALTARDMVAIIDALDEEKASKARSDSFNANHQVVLPETRKPALLNYWGFSYGTYLGNTFASMFPNRVGRMILDGNVDPIDYTATGWLSNLLDNNKNLHWFYYACLHAEHKCALFDSNTRNIIDLEAKMAKLLRRLHENPLPIVHDGGADIVTYADMTNLIHGASYAPLYFWTDVAQVAHDLLNNDATSMIKYLRHLEIPQYPVPEPKPPKKLDTGSKANMKLNNDTLPYPPDFPGAMEGSVSILCGDGMPLSLTKDDWHTRLSTLKNQSLIAGPHWAAITFACQHWPLFLRPAERNRFTGRFESKLADYDERASPILFIGSTADPVTPLRNAVANSKRHEGSVVLTQDTPGHCSGPANPSQCTFEVIRQFFADGVLPEEGKVCYGDRGPWDKVQAPFPG